MAGTGDVASAVDVGIVLGNHSDDKGQVVLYVSRCVVAIKSSVQ